MEKICNFPTMSSRYTKKKIKSFLKKCRPISLLPIFIKIFESVIYNFLFNHLQIDKLLTSSQPSCLPDDSCIVQLLSIIHEIQTTFGNNRMRGVFRDISKAFDKVYHSGLYRLMGLKASYFPHLELILIIINKE